MSPAAAEITIESVPSPLPLCLDETIKESDRNAKKSVGTQQRGTRDEISEEEKKQMLQQVQDQQADFGVGK
jgi:beta-galactosidase